MRECFADSASALWRLMFNSLKVRGAGSSLNKFLMLQVCLIDLLCFVDAVACWLWFPKLGGRARKCNPVIADRIFFVSVIPRTFSPESALLAVNFVHPLICASILFNRKHLKSDFVSFNCSDLAVKKGVRSASPINIFITSRDRWLSQGWW